MKYNFNIIGKRKVWFLLSLAVIIIGLASLLFNGINWGIDFVGGSVMNVRIGDFEISEVREVLAKHDLENAEIRKVDGSPRDEVFIRSRELTVQERQEIFASLKGRFNLTDADFLGGDKVSPVIGQELRGQAMLALLIAGVGMLAYITFRFEFKSGFAAIIALIHDMFVVIALFSILRIPVNVSFVAALLTIVGYSINDTIVLFDRIRENEKLLSRKTSFEERVNTSIMQTMARSINTSFTTLIVIASLLIFGGETIKDFALALFVGMLAGTYSSIFIASPIWVEWKERTAK